jgi:hypothetical protein
MDEMSSPRPLPDIQADIATTTRLLARLAQERRRARVARRLGIVADFDAGSSRAAIAAKWGIAYGQVATVLHKAGRNERTRRALGLSDSQRTDYQRLLRQGVRSMIARAIALRGP